MTADDAKLVDVHPDGYARNLSDGILRGRYRETTERRTDGTESLAVPPECQLLPWSAWRRAAVLISAHRRLFSDIGTMRSLPWKAPGNT